jgi:hypothetical protein
MQTDLFYEEVYDKFTFHADCSYVNCVKCNHNKNNHYNNYINTAKFILSLQQQILAIYMPGGKNKPPSWRRSPTDGGYFWIGVDLLNDQRFNFDLLITKNSIKFRRISYFDNFKVKENLVTLHEGIISSKEESDTILCQILSLVPKQFDLSTTTEECPICLHNKDMFRYYQCTHYVCADCHDLCVVHNLNTCSLCRSI